jgi:hypothetical protein
LKKSIACCISFIVIFFGEITINFACGPEQDPYDYYVSFYHNNLQGNRYIPFGFNGMLYLNSEKDVVDESQLNSSEWAKYLTVSATAVHQIMYDADSATNERLKKLSASKINELPDSLRKNSFIVGLANRPSALNYYQFAKSCEPLVAQSNYWNPKVMDTAQLLQQASVALKASTVTADAFLKLRYAYLSARMFHYGGDFEKCKKVYLQLIATSTLHSAVKGWGLALYAGAMRNTGHEEEAAYLFSKVFATSPERRIMAYRNYFWTNAKLSSVLKLAKNDEERANIWGINGFNQPDSDLAHLKEVYNCDVNHPLVAPLLIREVNKLEQNLLEKQKIAYDFFESYNSAYPYEQVNRDSLKSANLVHLSKVKEFALKIATDPKSTQHEFGFITAAYLSWIAKKDDLASSYLQRINVKNLSPRLYDQYRITQLLINANRIKYKQVVDEEALLPALKWLDEKRFAENKKQPIDHNYTWAPEDGESKFTATAANFYQQILAPAYAKIGDTAKAALAMLKGDLRYRKVTETSFSSVMSYQSSIFWYQALSPKVMSTLADYKIGSSNRLVLFLAAGLNQLKDDDFYELQGTAFLRSHDYAKAIQCFNKMSKSHKYRTPEEWEWLDNGQHLVHRLYSNPFLETINDSPKQIASKPTGWNKKTFAEQMLRLTNLAAKSPKNSARYYYQMANGLYQTGEFGNAWYLISYDAKIFQHPEFKYHYNGDYKLASAAKRCYQKARSLSTDLNFKAKCTYMIARCEQKRIEQSNYNGQSSAFLANPYFIELKNNYRKTPTFQTAATACSYFKEFLKGS